SAAVLEAPADIDVVAGNSEARVEAADGLERGFSECHVAAGDVLGLAVGEQDMRGAAGCAGDALRGEAVGCGDEIGAADADVIGAGEALREIVKPVRVGPGVVVEVGDDVVPGGGETFVARGAESLVFGGDQANRESSRD